MNRLIDLLSTSAEGFIMFLIYLSDCVCCKVAEIVVCVCVIKTWLWWFHRLHWSSSVRLLVPTWLLEGSAPSPPSAPPCLLPLVVMVLFCSMLTVCWHHLAVRLLLSSRSRLVLCRPLFPSALLSCQPQFLSHTLEITWLNRGDDERKEEMTETEGTAEERPNETD